MEKKVITEEQFRGVCKQALPHLKELIENLREIGFDGMTSITVAGDGYIALDAYDSGWSMLKLSGQNEARIVAILIGCQKSQTELSFPPKGISHDTYKTGQLMKMLAYETKEGQEHYGARLHHETSGAKVLTIDAGGIGALISYYATHKTDLGNDGE